MGEADVLWPGACQIYATTSGTAGGSPRYIPVTEAMLAHFRYAGLNSVLWYTVRSGNARVFRGRHLQVGGSTALTPIPESAPFEAYAGELSGIAALNLPGWVEKHLHEPGAEVAQIADWDEKVAAVTERTSGLDITLAASTAACRWHPTRTSWRGSWGAASTSTRSTPPRRASSRRRTRTPPQGCA
jgi:hypothetical protein